MVTRIDQQLEKVFDRFGRRREALLPCLKVAQREFGCVPREVISHLSQQLSVAPLDIYGAISFYGMLTTRDQGKYVVRICASLPCHLNRASHIFKAVEDELGILPGETTRDKLFTLEEVGCLGLCDRAPAMLINEQIHGPLTPSQVRVILMDLRAKEKA
jgi:iron-hydrogenase subunit gamma